MDLDAIVAHHAEAEAERTGAYITPIHTAEQMMETAHEDRAALLAEVDRLRADSQENDQVRGVLYKRIAELEAAIEEQCALTAEQRQRISVLEAEAEGAKILIDMQRAALERIVDARSHDAWRIAREALKDD